MELNYDKLYRYSFSLVSLVFITLAMFYYCTKSPNINGDEGLFISDLSLIKHDGWIEAIKKNVSIPYLLLVYPLSLILKDFIALRIVNILLVSFFLFYLYLFNGRKKKSLYLYLMFYISAAAFYYSGTNDTLFFVSLAIFLIESYHASINKQFNFSLALSALVVAIFTRHLFLVYSPVIIFGLYLLFKKEGLTRDKTVLPLGLLLLLILLNMPSILSGKGISYDKKKPPTEVISSWTQRQYLAQLQNNEGKRPFHSHPSWEETDAYLKQNGRDSLPDGTIQGVFFDFSFTLKEFVKDLIYIVLYHSRVVGLILTILILYYASRLLKNIKIDLTYFVPLSIIAMICIFAFIIISWIELRWLGAIFLLSIVVFSDLEQKQALPAWVFNLNYIFLAFLSIYGSYGLIQKLI